MDNVTVIKRKDISRPVMRQTVINGAEYLSFPAIEETGVVRHLMSTRLGGVSEGDLWSMNVSFSRGDKTDCGGSWMYPGGFCVFRSDAYYQYPPCYRSG